ncbi:hexuronate transporter [Shigella sonnei]|nr:hexuronate transporter [Shigella sonnei]
MRKIKGLRWYMIALVTLGTVLGYLTRNTVAAAAPTLMEELNISTQQYSYIIAAYSAAYTVMDVRMAGKYAVCAGCRCTG